eukprot:NODE_8238_length_715_cov_62.621622_g7984_i0.p1 GENE.NODE_8238_length_715_cov_62.621622_g7984_i0~~NODE_8238_length_715_cov_62.621622_g7984_i0.p1  ORF type:complete len:222 (-),score=54.99 NODE_8238_length_715_cov_62.621622_g7984_i0:50-670(-)
MSALSKKFKLVLLGEAGVGKSSIVLRLIKDEYVEFQHSTVGASFFRHSVPLDEMTVNFDIWDTAGQERYKSLASMYYRGAAAALVVYDITSAESLERAKYWVKELLTNSNDKIVIGLTGNKCDLEEQRKVTTEEAKAYADDHGLIFLESSAKASINVKELFEAIAKKLSKTASTAPTGSPSSPTAGNGKVSLNEPRPNKEKKKCCK